MSNRGAKPGERRGGRGKGSKNKATKDVEERLKALNCDPIEGMARIGLQAEQDAVNAFQSIVDGVKEASEVDDPESDAEAMLESLLARHVRERREHFVLAGQMYKELAQYVAPKRKAIEMTGADGESLFPDSIKVEHV